MTDSARIDAAAGLRHAIKAFFATRLGPQPSVLKCAGVVLLVLALSAGIGLRLIRLGAVPPGLHQDEACNGYDAYSILHTARDHHGNFLPILIQGFNDYRPPLFDYSIVPLVGLFGLKPAVVRLGAALWGCADLIAITMLAGLTMGLPGGVAAAILVALSPWHLSFSRYAVTYITGSATVSIAMVCFVMWLKRRRAGWLLLAGFFFGLSFYGYQITKVFCPLLIGWLALLYRRELARAWRPALAALALVVLITAPEALTLALHPEARVAFQRESIWGYMALNNPDDSIASRLAKVGLAGMACFTPSFLFERGEPSTLNLPRHGELLPEQAPLIVLGALALLGRRRRRLGLMIIGWLMLAAVPAAMTVPPTPPRLRDLPVSSVAEPGRAIAAVTSPARLQSVALETNRVTTWPPIAPEADETESWGRPLSAPLIFARASARRDLMALAPWTLLCALGLVTMLDLTALPLALRTAVAALLLAGSVFHGALFVRSYFTDFPRLAAPYFKYGIAEVIRRVDAIGDPSQPVIMSLKIREPYIFVLFYKQFPPALLQREQLIQGDDRFAPVLHFGRYYFFSPRRVWAQFPHGIFVYTPTERMAAPARFSVYNPDGTIAYNVVVK
jgi:hypothetical protein